MTLSVKKLACEITGVTSDSRIVRPGFVYVAIRGVKFNGEQFIEDALAKGALWIIAQENSVVPGICNKNNTIFVENPRIFLSELARYFYSPQPNNIVAVTGTNGKTSTVNFFTQFAKKAGYKSAAIGTLGLTSSDDLTNLVEFTQRDEMLTSPDTVTTNKMLQALCSNGFTHIGIEASSHGLSQYRLDNILFKAVGFTNLSRDHLDYHGTTSAYFGAKKRLFSELAKKDTVAVLNADIPEFFKLKEIAITNSLKVIEYGKNAKDMRIINHDSAKTNLEFFGKKVSINTTLTGLFQVYNFLCAAGLAISSDISEEVILETLYSELEPVRGRMELVVTTKLGSKIFIDYAHTPDALKKVLEDLRIYCDGRIILVFGCGGDRDQGKREMMGIIANDLSDIAIITDDNPRNEEPALIRKQIAQSMKNFIEIGNRRDAIFHAISIARDNDIVLIAGKGHEEYQIIGDKKLPFSDKGAILEVIAL
jgi:UDP-N-acetylmuramoyl-L-alanyl-D-glutamate--2,6-diaminopimelate ligase